ncbi:hypothetical protein CK203_081891 [Vitis vinifera]|uniref:Uncharacterized protein n=1 Tax=Vitis vinifera TaxID=29760 RepID=A0A438DXC5_VITVI|nr:hypothetical protein CK203_081891 [Vitis vinifera]
MSGQPVVNSYPTVRGFTAIGTGGDDFVQAMVVAVESVLQHPIPEELLPFRGCEVSQLTLPYKSINSWLMRYRSLLSHYPYDFKMHLYNSGVSLLMNARNFSFLCDVGCHNSSSYTSLIAALNDGSRVV